MGKEQGNGKFTGVVQQVSRDTAAGWTFKNPILAAGQMGYEIDARGLKFGDGVTKWDSLPYFGWSGSGSVTSVGASINGSALTIGGSPITTSGILSFTWNGSSSQVVLGNGSLSSISSLGYVPYTGASANVNLGSFSLTAFTVNIQRSVDADVTNLNINSGVANTSAFQINTNQPGLVANLDARNGYSLGLQVNDITKMTISTSAIAVTDAINMSFGTTTGTKIGTATSQKLAFWNKTPIVQPTNSISAATRTAVGGATLQLNDTYNIGGSAYTLPQIVSIILNLGLGA